MKRVIETIEALIPLLEQRRAWVKGLFIVWVVWTAIVVLVFIFVSPIETPSDSLTSKAHVKLIEVNDVDNTPVMLRRKNHVRLLREIENELRLDKIPNGVFGFVFPDWIGPRLEAIPIVHRNSLGARGLEIHKLQDGTVVFLGYVSQENILKLETSKEPIEIHLFTIRWDEASTLVSIPFSWVLWSENRRFRDGYVLDLSLRPAR